MPRSPVPSPRAVVVTSMLIAGVCLVARPAAGQARKGYTAAQFGVELDGQVAGWIMNSTMNATSGEITMQLGLPMPKRLQDWARTEMQGNHVYKNGAVIEVDQNHDEIMRREFFGALLTRVSLPTLDAGSKDVFRMTIGLKSTTFRTQAGSGKPFGNSVSRAQKTGMTSHFRVHLDGLDDAAQYVTRVGPITWSQVVTSQSAGKASAAQMLPGKSACSPLNLRVGDAHAQSLAQLMAKPGGENGAAAGRAGSIEIFSADDKTVIFALDFTGLRLVHLDPDSNSRDKVKRVKAVFSCDRMVLRAMSGPA